jgi:hypothetical protein
MSISDYWVAKMNATEESGAAIDGDETVEFEVPVEEADVAVDEDEFPVVEDEDDLEPGEDLEVTEEVEAPVEEAADAVEEPAAVVPTAEQTKAQISEWLTATVGIDPDDLKSLNKAELLDLVNDVGTGE